MDDKTWSGFSDKMRLLSDLSYIGNVLGWDQQTMMPPKGAPARGRAMGTLASLGHAQLTDPALGDLIEDLESQELGELERVMVARMRRNRDQQVKLPADLVQQIAETTSAAHQVWAEARQRNDYKAFAPTLEKILDLLRQKAEHLGYEDEPYDAHLDLFEMGTKTKDVEAVFAHVAQAVRPLLDRVKDVDTSAWELPKTPNHTDAVLEYSKGLVGRMGFDMEAGRVDLTTHPFCAGTDPGDIRLTTRVDPNNPKECIMACIHEMGHGLYQQGIPSEWMGTSIGSYISLGVHESQSRLWENHVGRGRAFWEGEAATAASSVPAWKGLGPEDFYRATNRVLPESFIRVEADELTYPMHVILRFEIELAVSRGELGVNDLPAAWNELMNKHLGIVPPTDALGVLQDVHWSSALFGYFPTYLLGSIYAAALYDKATADLGGGEKLGDSLRAGDFSGLLGWLRENIHSKGSLLDPMDLVNQATGKPAGSPIDIDPYTRHLSGKVEDLYS